MIVDLSMGLFMQLPHAHVQSKRRPVLPNFPLQKWLNQLSKITTSTRPQSQTSKAFILVSCDGVNHYDPWTALQTAVGRLTWTLTGPNL